MDGHCSGFAKWGSGKGAGVTPCSRAASRSFLGKGYCVPHYQEARADVLDGLVDLEAEYQRGWAAGMAAVKDACRGLSQSPPKRL